MDDLISKASVCEVLADIYPTDGEKVVAVKEIDKAYEAILHLPSAQPTPCDVCRHNPPSSMDRKPCCVCPAERRTDDYK